MSEIESSIKVNTERISIKLGEEKGFSSNGICVYRMRNIKRREQENIVESIRSGAVE